MTLEELVAYTHECKREGVEAVVCEPTDYEALLGLMDEVIVVTADTGLTDDELRINGVRFVKSGGRVSVPILGLNAVLLELERKSLPKQSEPPAPLTLSDERLFQATRRRDAEYERLRERGW